MGKYTDLTNQRFGMLTVLERGEPKPRSGGKFDKTWICRCDCNRITTVLGSSLKRGNTRSCGCLSVTGPLGNNGKIEYPITDQLKQVKNAYRIHKNRAKGREIPFTLSLLEFENLILQACYYCGTTEGNYSYGFNHMGLDRVNSEGGYTQGNVVACCARCNLAKNNQSVDEFRAWIKRVYEFQYK